MFFLPRPFAKSATLKWHHIKPIYRSPYSPDFNPIERLWQHVKGQSMAGFLTSNGEALTSKLLDSLKELLYGSKLVRSVRALPSFNRK